MHFKFNAFLIRLFQIAAIVCCANADAWPPHGLPVGASGFAQLNLGGGDLIPADFINILHVGSEGFSGGATPQTAALDANGYPTQSFTGLVSITFNNTFWTGTQYTAIWTAGTQLQIVNLGTNSSCSLTGTGGSVSGCTGGNVTLTISGAGAGSMTWTTSTFSLQFPGAGSYGAAGTASLAIVRASDVTAYTTYGPAVDYRGLFTPEQIAALQGAHAQAIRPMGWVDAGPAGLSTDVQWAYRSTLSSLSWTSPRFPPSVQSSSITYSSTSSGGCSATGGSLELYTAAPTTDTPGTPSDGSVIQGSLSSANTTTSPMLCVGGVAYPIVTMFALAPSASAVAVGNATFIFDGVLNKWLYQAGGLTGTIPIEAQVSMANGLNVNLWATIPYLANNNYITQEAAYVCGNLKSTLFYEPEYTNELWNFGFPETQWAFQRGLAMGFPNANNQPYNDFYGIRVAQIMGSLIPAACSGQMSRVRRTLMSQAEANPPTTVKWRMGGYDLAPSGTSTGIGNAVYSAYTGSADYTTFPNRPIDVVDVIGYAPYTAGTNFSDQSSNGGTTATANNASFLQTLATAFASNASDPTSLASLDNDFRQGTVAALTYNSGTATTFSCPTGTTFSTSAAHGYSATSTIQTGSANNMIAVFQATGGTVCNGLTAGTGYCFVNVTTMTFQIAAFASNGGCGSTPISVSPGTGVTSVGPANATSLIGLLSEILPAWEAIAEGFDSQRPAGMVSLRVEWYEGAPQPVTPSATTLTNIGVLVPPGSGTGAAANTALQAGLLAWKNSASPAVNYGIPFMASYFGQFVNPSLFPHSKVPSHLVLPGGGQYSLLSAALPNSTPYQLYYGFAQFNFLLKRDFAPAANDNTPMFLPMVG